MSRFVKNALNTRFDQTLNYVAGTLGGDVFNTITNVKMFPWLAKGDGVTDDTAAIQAAINWMETQEGGGTVLLTRGEFLETGLTVPASVYLVGEGERATSLLYNGSGNAVLCGGTAGALYYHLGVKNMRILLTHVDATAVLAMGTASGKFHDLYIEGPLTYPRNTKGVVFDGGNASSFFNDVRNVLVNHIHTGFYLTTTGTVNSTAQYFTNCAVNGDVASDPNSVCLLVETNQGNGTVWMGGNAESCGRGFYYNTNAHQTSIFGARLEGNTYDIYLKTPVGQQTFVGLINLDQAKIYDESGNNGTQHTFVGCIEANPADLESPHNVWPGTQKFVSKGMAVTPISVIAFPGQTANLQENKTSGGVVTSGINADMNPFGNHFKFPAVQVPSEDANALDDYEEGDWTPVIYSGATDAAMNAATQGKYTKVGRAVHIQAYVHASSVAAIGGGDITIKGLPFTVNSGYAGYGGSTASWGGNLNIAGGQSVAIRPNSGEKTLGVLIWSAATGTANMTGTLFSDDGYISFSLTYFV
jgi:hypothetical protein